jgi:hypothetical protein
MKAYPNFRDLERLSGITWCGLTALEPRLEELLWRARTASVNCNCWPDVDRLFRPVWNDLVDVVGFSSRNHRHPILGTTAAYEVAYWKLFDAVVGLLPGPADTALQIPKRQWSAKAA